MSDLRRFSGPKPDDLAADDSVKISPYSSSALGRLMLILRLPAKGAGESAALTSVSPSPARASAFCCRWLGGKQMREGSRLAHSEMQKAMRMEVSRRL